MIVVTPNKTLWGSKKLEHQEFSNGEGLQWYNYDVRPYDAQIGRWHNADLLAEQAPNWSPYRYCYSNPVNYTDPSGLKEVPQEAHGVWSGGGVSEFMAGMMDFNGGYTFGGGGGGGGGGTWGAYGSANNFFNSAKLAMDYRVVFNKLTGEMDYREPIGTYSKYIKGGYGIYNGTNYPSYAEGYIKGRRNEYVNTGHWVYAPIYGETVSSKSWFDKFIDGTELTADITGAFASGSNKILKRTSQYMASGVINKINKNVIVQLPLGLNLSTNSKILKSVKVAGKVMAVANIVATGVEVGQDWNEGKYKNAGARVLVAGIAAGAAFIPVVGWGIALGIGIADYTWGDDFYKWVEK
jgi:RHS repeat-associated protein